MLVPQSMAATLIVDARSGRPPLAEQLEHLVAQRVTPGRPRARGRRDVQALDPVGLPAGGDTLDLGHLTERAEGEVGLVGRPVGRCQFGVLPQPGLHLLHQPRALEGADQRRRPRAGEVVGCRERRAVGQPRLGGDHVRVAARAPVSHLVDGPRWPPQLGADDLFVLGRRHRPRPSRRRCWRSRRSRSPGGGVLLRRVAGELHRLPASSYQVRLAPADLVRVGQLRLRFQGLAGSSNTTNGVSPGLTYPTFARLGAGRTPGPASDASRSSSASMLARRSAIWALRSPMWERCSQVGPQRRGVGDRQHGEHHHQDRCPAGAVAIAPSTRYRCVRRASRVRAEIGRAVRAARPGPERPRGRDPRGVRRLSAMPPRVPRRTSSSGTPTHRRTEPRRRAAPRSAAAGCTWPCARSGPGRRS